MTEAEEKGKFAELLLKHPNDPFKAALILFPDNTNRALMVASQWPFDSEVIAARNELNEDDFLPSKADLARSIWERMQNERLTADDYTKLGKLYADIRGFIQKASTNVSVEAVFPRAIEVPTHGTNDQWEVAAEQQQKDLLNVSRSRH